MKSKNEQLRQHWNGQDKVANARLMQQGYKYLNGYDDHTMQIKQS